MPFHEGVYYSYPCDTLGTPSSAGIPSVLSSPLSHHFAPAPGMTPSSGASSVIPPFKFRPRRESVDWRRINSVDIDSVVSQLDVDTLQEHFNTVTFGSLEGERCQRCQSPVDQTLVKLYQLAQLTVEWLLYCQDVLTLKLQAAEERMAAVGREREQLLAQQKKQEEKVKVMGSELKQRKKIIRSQQSMLTPRIISSQKCQHCDKSFMNSTFLQNHMQRRHPDEYEIRLRSDTEQKSLIESLRMEISGLKEQVARQQQELQARVAQEKEQQSLHQDLLREMDRFKAEEMARMDRKIEDSRDGIRREMEYFYTRNIQALNEANLNQNTKNEKSASPERDVDNYKEMQMKVTQQMKKQEKKWESRLQESMAQHESEKNQLLNELNRMQQEMERRLQERDQTIREQRQQIKDISFNPPTKVVEVPVIVSAPTPEPKPKRVVLDSSSLSERRVVEKKPKPAPEKKKKVTSNILRNSNIKKDVRPDIMQDVVKRLESLGVKPDQSGVKTKQLDSLLAKIHSRRHSFAKGKPDYWSHRQEIISVAEQKLDHQWRGSGPPAETQATPRGSVPVSQIRPRSSSLPSRVTRVKAGPAVRQPKTPQPAPRTKTPTQPKTSTPITKTAGRNFFSKTPPFSSDEDSEDQTDTEDDHPEARRRRSPIPRAGKASPDRRPVVTRSFSSVRQQTAASAGGVTKTAVAKMQSDEEDDGWSDVSELEEIPRTLLQSHKDQSGNVDKKKFGDGNKINELARTVEKQLAGRVVKKPPGGVSILPERKDEVQELTYTDLEEGSEWMVSSLEERQEPPKPAQGSGPLRKSLDSPSTSVWGSSTGRDPRPGLTGGGTGSTLRGSLCSLSDVSDSEDISSKY
ncbi:cilium assembly protein DZIP1 isoform X2 [Antennarius striatus]|uniref:cilium assembly protein DZIP1 isoform X2 n=1 Tax=Antennarius striatus TaxID=241820 RepID=UPI0035B2FC26